MNPEDQYRSVESKTRFIIILLGYALSISFLSCVAVVFVLSGGPGPVTIATVVTAVVVAAIGIAHLMRVVTATTQP